MLLAVQAGEEVAHREMQAIARCRTCANVLGRHKDVRGRSYQACETCRHLVHADLDRSAVEVLRLRRENTDEALQFLDRFLEERADRDHDGRLKAVVLGLQSLFLSEDNRPFEALERVSRLDDAIFPDSNVMMLFTLEKASVLAQLGRTREAIGVVIAALEYELAPEDVLALVEKALRLCESVGSNCPVQVIESVAAVCARLGVKTPVVIDSQAIRTLRDTLSPGSCGL